MHNLFGDTHSADISLDVNGQPLISHITRGDTVENLLRYVNIDRITSYNVCYTKLLRDAILVHHGYFWGNEAPQIRGMKKRRLQALLRHDINLLAYHLPLDAHPQLGNNVQLSYNFV